MRVYAGMEPGGSIVDILAHARRVEALGYDGLHVPETVHDALALSLLIAEHTQRITIRTSVALAFPRSPTLTAYAAWDVAKFSGGRFELGLGTQIRQNIEDRYGMPWADPVGQMRDYLGALQALFACFRTGESISYESEHYRLTRLQPYFNPGPDPDTAPPPLWLGGVNPKMCQLAGELAAGFVTHPTNSNPRYLESIALPNMAQGAERTGRGVEEIELVIGTTVITGRTTAELDTERERQRQLFAFLYSTPAYRRTLELYGWPELTEQLGALVRAGNWDALSSVVTDEVLDAIVPCAPYSELADVLVARLGHLGHGVLVAPPADPAADREFRPVLEALQSASGRLRPRPRSS